MFHEFIVVPSAGAALLEKTASVGVCLWTTLLLALHKDVCYRCVLPYIQRLEVKKCGHNGGSRG